MAFLDVALTSPASGQVVVLMHGRNFSAGTWEATIRTLVADVHRVIAPDQIGFCKFTKPTADQFSFQQHALTSSAGS